MSARDLFGLIGQTIAGKFRVERLIGEGGFGVVYAGTHVMLGEQVAIKCLKPLGFTPEDRARGAQSFLREGRILFGLGHPAIVRLYDVGVIEEGQIPYVVLELLAGTTLEAEIKSRGMARRQVGRDELVAIFEPILEAVGFAHERGIVHRDLKPSNLMLVNEGGRVQPKVLDFGTARADDVGTGRAAAATHEASLGKTGFTPLYAAPEQWDAVYGTTGPRTDVYALGLTIAEVCLLEYPMEVATGGILAVFKASLDDSSRPLLARSRPDLPPDLERVVLRAMRARPDQRFADAREMLAAFRSAMKVAPGTAPFVPPLAPAPALMSPPLMSPPPMSPPPSPSYGPPQGNYPQTSSYGPPMIGASTTQPHALGTYGASAPARSSAAPWVIGIAGIVIAMFVVVVGVVVAVVLPKQREDAAAAAPAPTNAGAATTGAPAATAPAATTAAAAAKPGAPSVPGKPGAPAVPATVAPAAPVAASGPAPRIILGSAIGMSPFWTQGEVMDVARAHQADMVGCAREGIAAQAGLAGDVDITVSPTKLGVVESIQCSVRGPHGGAGETALCGCLSSVMGRWKFPAAHGKLGALDSAPFILDYKLQ